MINMNDAMKDQLTQVLANIIFSPHSIFCDNQESLEHVIARWNEAVPEEYKVGYLYVRSLGSTENGLS